MTWENQSAGDKNLEALRHEFSLENIRGADVLTKAPDVNELNEGEERIVFLTPTLYKYVRYNGALYRSTYTAV